MKVSELIEALKNEDPDADIAGLQPETPAYHAIITLSNGEQIVIPRLSRCCNAHLILLYSPDLWDYGDNTDNVYMCTKCKQDYRTTVASNKVRRKHNV